MLSVRWKILLGFGGLLLILVTVGLVANMVFREYAATNQRVLRDDLTSVTAADDLQSSVQTISQLLSEARRSGSVDSAALASAEKTFDAALLEQTQSVTLPTEQQATAHLANLWAQYESLARQFRDDPNPEHRADFFRDQIVPVTQQLRQTIGEIFRMNAEDIGVAHGEAKALATKSAWTMLALTLCAGAIAIVFSFAIGRMILRPIAILTNVVGQIEHGNLEPSVPIESHDELGTLGAAVNRMSAELRSLRKIDRERLVRTQRTTQLAIDSLPDAVFVISQQNAVEIVNETASRVFQISANSELCNLDPRLTAMLRRVDETGRPQHAHDYGSTIRAAVDGQTRYFMPSAVPIVDEDRRIIGTTIVLSDVTHLRRLDEMKDNLLSLVSHELKTPLTTIRLALPLLLEERIGTLLPAQRELLSAAGADADRLHQIVENLLDMGRIAAGKATMEIRNVDPLPIVQQAIERAQKYFAERQIKILIQRPAQSPKVRADAVRIGHALNNLLDNAQRYSPTNGEVRLTVRELDDVVEFGVSDSGVGIPRQYLPRIFEKFFRVPGQNGDGGSGLGLALVKDIIEAHGGSIVVESVEGRGTTFRFTLRRADRAFTESENHELHQTDHS